MTSRGHVAGIATLTRLLQNHQAYPEWSNIIHVVTEMMNKFVLKLGSLMSLLFSPFMQLT